MAVLLSIDRVAPLIAIVRRQGSPRHPPPSFLSWARVPPFPPPPSPHSLTQEIRGLARHWMVGGTRHWQLRHFGHCISPLPPGLWVVSTVQVLYCTAVFIVVCLSGGDV